MRLKQVEAFNAIMLTGSVSAAARLLHVTQPAVTQVLKHAELQLGYPLFTRQRNRLVPTREAQGLYPEVQGLMTQLDSVRRMAKALSGEQVRPLRVLIVPSLAVKALPDALLLLRKRHPSLSVAVRMMHSHEIVRALALQEADVGVAYGKLSHPAVQDEVIASGCVVYVSPKGTGPVERRRTVTMQEILRSPFVSIDERDPLGAALADLWARQGVTPQASISVQTRHIALVMAQRGFGPAIVDSFTAQIGGDEVVVRTITPEVPIEVVAQQPLGVRSPKPVAAFIAAMRQALLNG